MPFSTTRQIFGFLARFAVFYAAIFSAAWGLSLFRHADAVVLKVASGQLAMLERPAISRTLAIAEDGELVEHVTTSRVRNLRLTHQGGAWVSHNWFVFLALVLASPGLGWRGRLIALGAGTAAILWLDGVMVMGTVWEADRLYLSSLHPGISAGPLANVVHLAGALRPGGLFMAPVFLWIFTLLALPVFRRTPAPGSVSRNDPCPCGSGLKFKRCCG